MHGVPVEDDFGASLLLLLFLVSELDAGRERAMQPMTSDLYCKTRNSELVDEAAEG